MTEESTFKISDTKVFKLKMLSWLKRFNIFCFLDNHNYSSPEHSFEWLAAAGSKRETYLPVNTWPEVLRGFHNGSWLFGHLGYDLKNHDPSLNSDLSDKINFPDGFFFEPEIVLKLIDDSLTICCDTPEIIFKEIERTTTTPQSAFNLTIQNRITKPAYMAAVNSLLGHIHRGDCYEINFCQEFFSEDAELDPAIAYTKLTEISPNPFAAFYKLNNKYCICASPERYLKKRGSILTSQPIKGTASRNVDPVADELSKDSLRNSFKNQTENVMIVDLVRNDLSKVCIPGSVTVTELFSVIPYPGVYQMVSTIKGEMKNNDWVSALHATFPMGSMTGAPKKRVMQLTEQYEKTKRGIYSGAIGYVNPDADFDFNVVIRSIQYNAENKYLNFMAGGGITSSSNPEEEYEESILKTNAIRKMLRDN